MGITSSGREQKGVSVSDRVRMRSEGACEGKSSIFGNERSAEDFYQNALLNTVQLCSCKLEGARSSCKPNAHGALKVHKSNKNNSLQIFFCTTSILLPWRGN